MEVQKILSDRGFIDEIYNAMQEEDLSHVVLTMLDKLTKINQLPEEKNFRNKCENTSTINRISGNEAFVSGLYQKALQLYNTALSHAPEGSAEMKLAYSNRSALLLKTKAYSACLQDIDICYSMGCSQDIEKKLRHREKECKRLIYQENLWETIIGSTSTFLKEFFKFKVKPHPQIPCASTDINVIIENQVPKIVAANNIKVGTIVAIEPSYVSHLGPEHYATSCYYCHRMCLNLIPCKGCTYALFCDKDCEKKCLEEYHTIECQIMEFLEDAFPNSKCRLTVKAVLKIKQMCKSWKELISVSYDIALDRMRNSSVNEMYDVHNKFSILNLDDTRHFVHGKMFNHSIRAALIIHLLRRIPSFLPESPDESHEALRAIARITMQLDCHIANQTVHINSSSRDIEPRETNFVNTNIGLFSLTSKLKHCCDANLIVVGLGNKVALLALHPIEKGSELNISYVFHWYNTYDVGNYRALTLFQWKQLVCNCYICTGKWDFKSLKGNKLTTEEQKAYRKWVCIKNNMPHQTETFFKATCEALAVLRNAINTQEHLELINVYRGVLCLLQCVETRNLTLSS